MAAPSSFLPTSSNSKKRSRRDTDLDVVPASSTAYPPRSPKATHDHQQSDRTNARNLSKKQRVGPSVSSIPRTLPTQPHEELVQELGGKYSIQTLSIISSSKINKKVTSVLSHLGHVDLFDPKSRPGVIMLHSRDKDASKMVTVVEVAKRRLTDSGQPWFQYNRVYQVAGQPSAALSHNSKASKSDHNNRRVDTQTVIDDTILGDSDEDDSEDAFEPVENAFDQAVREKPAVEPTSTYMSMFLARVPIPELQAKSFISLQTNSQELEQR